MGTITLHTPFGQEVTLPPTYILELRSIGQYTAVATPSFIYEVVETIPEIQEKIKVAEQS